MVWRCALPEVSAAAAMGFRGYWDAHEEDMLRRGVQKHGIGSWERIRHDPEFKILKCVRAHARVAERPPATCRRRCTRLPRRKHMLRARQRGGGARARVGRRVQRRRLRIACCAKTALPHALRELTACAARLPRRRGRTGVQLKDKWRNLVRPRRRGRRLSHACLCQACLWRRLKTAAVARVESRARCAS